MKYLNNFIFYLLLLFLFVKCNSKKENYIEAKKELLESYEKRVPTLFQKPQETFIKTIDSIEQKLIALLPKINDDAFLLREKKNLKYQKIYELHRYKTKKLQRSKFDYFEINKIQDIINGINYLDKNEFVNNPIYKNLSIKHFVTTALETGRIDIGGAFYTLSAINIAELKEVVMGKLMGAKHFQNLENANALFTYIKYNTTDENLILKAQGWYEKIKEKNEIKKGVILAGYPSPKFMGFENYKGGKTSLDDLRGSYLYIDVWATWCAPCKKEIPHIKKIVKFFKGKNIKFVGISIDKNKTTWKNTVKKEKIEGIQLWQTNTDFQKAYKIFGIPRYIIIDPKGNIINSHASRPSNPDTKNILTKLLNKKKII